MHEDNIKLPSKLNNKVINTLPLSQNKFIDLFLDNMVGSNRFVYKKIVEIFLKTDPNYINTIPKYDYSCKLKKNSLYGLYSKRSPYIHSDEFELTKEIKPYRVGIFNPFEVDFDIKYIFFSEYVTTFYGWRSRIPLDDGPYLFNANDYYITFTNDDIKEIKKESEYLTRRMISFTRPVFMSGLDYYLNTHVVTRQ